MNKEIHFILSYFSFFSVFISGKAIELTTDASRIYNANLEPIRDFIAYAGCETSPSLLDGKFSFFQIQN